MRALFLAAFTVAAMLAVAARPAVAQTLPLGDGRVANGPKVGHVFACQTRFFGGGAFRRGFWIGEQSWTPSGKPTVGGAIAWPDATINIAVEDDERVIRANGLPAHATGIFPIGRDEEAYSYDRNPNSIAAQPITLSLPRVPGQAAEPSCVGMGTIAIALSGVAIFNALDARGADAPAHEIQDSCGGHPERSGRYHYHDLSPCLTDKRGEAGGHSDLLGYVIDGFGIYGPHGADGRELTNADLDPCHGHTHTVNWDETPREIYHYHFTREYPYTVGGLRGTAARTAARRHGMDRGAKGPGGGRPAATTDGDPLSQAARELGVSADALRDAVGPPPPDFEGAARKLDLDAEDIRRALGNARGAGRSKGPKGKGPG